MKLNDPVTSLKGVGTALSAKLQNLGVITINDLFNYYPRRYEDYSTEVKVAHARPGAITIRAKISHVTPRYSRRGLHVTEAVASDDSGSIRLIWFNQPYRAKSIDPEQEYFVSGEYGLNHQRFSMINPSIELTSNFPVNTARIVPVYRVTKGLQSNQVRQIMKKAFGAIDLIQETLPAWLVKDYKLQPKSKAVATMHFPESAESLDRAKDSLAFEEMFALSLAALMNKLEIGKLPSIKVKFDLDLAREFVKNLPFKLTDEQRSAVWQIYKDMGSDSPMNRLLEGDVGTGKTVVSAMASVMVLKQDFQVAFMAPTELLATQHAKTIFNLLEPLGMADSMTILLGSLSAAQKANALSALNSGKVKFIVGTHALIQEKVNLDKLGLVVIDEQHRFGVEQRHALLLKTGHMPHLLSMSATPIPRSLQLTLFGELDVTIIRSKPYVHKPIITKICTLNERTKTYETIGREIEKGNQVFIVCPLISESNDLPFRSAEEVYAEVTKGVFKKYKVALLHGKLKTAEKEQIMRDFVDRRTDVLVATTIVEVGVDVPDATVMMIESAERFGLAQIHQLRGRVGRSDKQGYCYLLLDDNEQPSRRLRAVESTQDGFKLAELDLLLRGPGAVYGYLQHGPLDLRLANFNDRNLILSTRQAAQTFIDKKESLLQYKELNDRINRLRKVTRLN